ncbi:c-type cytochrome [Luteibaculum oceani]|uniref:Cytochrome c n=1 Tax=Luteibaculum oceani TaxID=1294296 RepID=A0A5C6UU42_9FLAO|nr:c-type cytochrome [Luteibaculum oceani]TXC76120.1 cytochrome c [Luteibaculum oceani]
MKVLRFFLFLIAILLIFVGGFLVYLKVFLPKAEQAPEITVELTPQNIERGKYLANHVMLCMDCHAQRDWTTFAAPPVKGSMGAGGERFDQMMGFPGKFVSPNITPAGLGKWTDGEIYRAITTGISKDGRALFNLMPYHHYGKMDPEDIKSVIAYIRTLDPVDYQPEKSEPDFPMNFIINTLPKKATPSKRPSQENLIAYGEYLVNAAACYDCHTKQEKGEFIGEDFAGGMEFHFPDGSILRSANITPHETGIGAWSEEQFISRFRQYTDSSYVPPKVKAGEFQTVMPWLMYAHMDTNDLRAIYAYLKSLPAKENKVELITAAL